MYLGRDGRGSLAGEMGWRGGRFTIRATRG